MTVPVIAEFAVRARLLEHAGVVALVADRVTPHPLPQVQDASKDLPAITYFQVSGSSGITTTGETGPDRARVQIDCWAVTCAVAKDVAAQVQDALHGFRGVVGGVDVQGAFVDDSGRDEYEDDTKLHRVSADYFVHT